MWTKVEMWDFKGLAGGVQHFVRVKQASGDVGLTRPARLIQVGLGGKDR